jgi:predicted nucleic acid-binding protein
MSMSKIFLDSDVLLDLFIEREPHHTIAQRLLTALKRKGLKCYTSPIVLANVNYILAKAKGRTYSIGKLRSLRAILNVLQIDERMVDAAVAAPQIDFEDILQLQCALANRVDTLITRNVRHYPKTRIQIVDPMQYLSSERNRE